MNKKKLLVIHLNEFNYDFLVYGAKKYNLEYLKKLLKLKKISTFTRDKIQNKNLDPWVQGVSITTGKNSKNHKIFKLGQKIEKGVDFIWDVLANKNINCFICGSINSKFKENKHIKLFFPDPWNYESDIKPKKLKNLSFLPKFYAKNYVEPDFFQISKYSILFFISFIQNQGIVFFIKNFVLIFSTLSRQGIKNFILFFLFDLISLHIFKKNIKSSNRCFSYIFLNSLAHFQHNNWNDQKLEKYYFKYVEQIVKEIFEIYQEHTSLLVFNGFSQKKVDNEYLIRPKNPKTFLSQIIKFRNIEQDMTNGGFIFFKNKIDADNAYKKLKNYKICGLKIFEVLQKKNYSFYYRIIIKTKKNIKELNINKLKTNILESYFKYENNNKKIKMKLNKEELLRFLDLIKFIKVSGIHSENGTLFMDNISNLGNKISLENHKIFSIFKNYFQ